MSKRNNEGEVIYNKFAVGLAKQQQQLLSLFGESIGPAIAESHDEKAAAQTTSSLAELRNDGDDEGYIPHIWLHVAAMRLIGKLDLVSAQWSQRKFKTAPSPSASQLPTKDYWKI